MSDPTDLPPDDDRVRVAEYVLGLLDADAVADLERRIASEPALRRLHAEWADTLSGLAAGPDVAPPPWVRAAIEDRLFPAAPRERGWLRLAGLFGAPAAAFTAAFLLLQPVSDFDPTLHVDLIVPEIGLNVAAGVDEDTLRIINQGDAPPPDRDYEVWLIAGDAAPVSLGLLPVSGAIDVPRPPGLATGVVFAISEEPSGGSPTGAPTGPVLAAEPLFDL